MTVPITIVLAASHPAERDSLRQMLEAQPDCVVVGEVADDYDTLPLVQRLKPQVLIVELQPPGLGGLEVAAEVTHETPATRVIILSTSHADVFVLEALRNGAAGFVSRDTCEAELVRAVREVVAGRHFLSPPLSEAVIEAYLGGVTSVGDAYGTLTRREREVLRLVAEGLSAKEIARRLGISPRTAETHRSHVMRKLGLHGRTELIRFAIRRGIVPPDADQQMA